MPTILIVEDHEDMRRELKKLLGGVGEIYECSDGSEAFSAYESHQPDWVLMDIRMEKMNGIAAARKIKAAHPEARIVIVTGYDDLELREAARRAGACGYVLKENLAALLNGLTKQE